MATASNAKASSSQGEELKRVQEELALTKTQLVRVTQELLRVGDGATPPYTPADQQRSAQEVATLKEANKKLQKDLAAAIQAQHVAEEERKKEVRGAPMLQRVRVCR